MVAALLAVGCVRGLRYTGSAELAVCPSAYSCMYPVGYIESPDSSTPFHECADLQDSLIGFVHDPKK